MLYVLWMLCLWLNLVSRLLRVHGGKLQASRAFLMCSISCCNMCWLDQTTFAPNANVLNTLFLAEMKWLLTQWRYWSMCVGFLYTVVTKVLLGLGETRMSRTDKVPSWLGSSVVKCMCGSCELMCCSDCWLCFACWMTKVSSTNLSHKQGVYGAELMALTSNFFPCWQLGDWWGNPWQCHGPVHNPYHGRGSMCF